MDERAKACDLVINWCSPYPEIKSASGVCSFDTSQKDLSFFLSFSVILLSSEVYVLSRRAVKLAVPQNGVAVLT